MDIEYGEELRVVVDEEELKMWLLVDAIVEKASFPNGRWTIPEGVKAVNVSD